MSAILHFLPGKAEPVHGISLPMMVELMAALDAAGLSSNLLMGRQATIVVADGSSLDPDASPSCFAMPFGRGLALFMQADTMATVRRGSPDDALCLAVSLHGEPFHRAAQGRSVELAQRFAKNHLVEPLANAHPLAAEWLARGERGSSSEALCKLFFGSPPQAGHAHPSDPSDLRRCVRFLEATQTSGRIAEAAELSGPWAALAAQWERLVSLLADEMPSGQAPLCMNAMNAILAEQASLSPRKSPGAR